MLCASVFWRRAERTQCPRLGSQVREICYRMPKYLDSSEESVGETLCFLLLHKHFHLHAETWEPPPPCRGYRVLLLRSDYNNCSFKVLIYSHAGLFLATGPCKWLGYCLPRCYRFNEIEFANKSSGNCRRALVELDLRFWFVVSRLTTHTHTRTENTGVSLLEDCPMLSIRPSVPVHSACILEFGAQRFPWDERYLHVGYNTTSFRTYSNYLLPLCQFSGRYKAIWLSLLLSALVVPLHKSVCNHISVLSFSRSLKAALILSALYFIL